MTTTEKINVGVAVLAALGVGSALTVLVGHLLSRRERQVNVADKFVQMATSLTEGLNGQLSRVQEELTEARHENAELRAELEETKAVSIEGSERLRALERKAQSASNALDQADHSLSVMRKEVTQARDPHAMDRWVAQWLIRQQPKYTDSNSVLMAAVLRGLAQAHRNIEPPEEPTGARKVG